MKIITTVALASLLALNAACKRVDDTALDQETALKASDELLTAALSGDAERLDAMYDRDVIAVDAVARNIANGATDMHRFNQGFIDLKFDKMSYSERKVQILGHDSFMVTSRVHAESALGPLRMADFRATDLFRRQEDGTYKVINEHISFPSDQ